MSGAKEEEKDRKNRILAKPRKRGFIPRPEFALSSASNFYRVGQERIGHKLLTMKGGIMYI